MPGKSILESESSSTNAARDWEKSRAVLKRLDCCARHLRRTAIRED